MCDHCKDFYITFKEVQYCPYCGENITKLKDPLTPIKQALWCCVTTDSFKESDCAQCFYKDRNPCPAQCNSDFAKDILEVLNGKLYND